MKVFSSHTQLMLWNLVLLIFIQFFSSEKKLCLWSHSLAWSFFAIDCFSITNHCFNISKSFAVGQFRQYFVKSIKILFNSILWTVQIAFNLAKSLLVSKHCKIREKIKLMSHGSVFDHFYVDYSPEVRCFLPPGEQRTRNVVDIREHFSI